MTSNLRLRHYAALTLLAGALSACAAGPDSIQPTPMAGAFASTPCNAVGPMLAQERATLDALSAKQRSAQTGDAIGVFLIGVPVSSLSGGDNAGGIATSKGKIIALEARMASCG